jgi:hypothetical protein
MNKVFFIGNPEIPWKGPKEFEIDPDEFNNLEVIVSGRATVSRSHIVFV